MANANATTQVLSGGQSAKVLTSTVSAQSAALTSTSYLCISDVNCFVRTGASPVAVSNGTDQLMLANVQYRFSPINIGDKLAFILSAGSGNVYLTPDA
jgi:hypothetical protein